MPKPTLPAEWHAQDAILITWPHIESAWSTTIENVEQTYLNLVSTISHYQDLIIQVHSTIDCDRLSFELSKHNANLGRCHFATMPSNDTWARDHGPISILHDNEPQTLNFQFNGWGNKFESSLDNELNTQLAAKNILKNSIDVNWVLEGGSIEADGQGTLLTTSQCLLNENRNGLTTKDDVEKKLISCFGNHRILWLTKGYLEGDDTDAHIDTLARFANEETIIFQGCANPDDSHFTCLNEMKNELTNFQTSDQKPYNLIELPLPEPKLSSTGHRLPATYANFLITNKLVIVPTYEDKHDEEVLRIFESVFPKHIIKGINALPLIEEHGSIHCITMQLIEGSVNFDGQFESSIPTLG